MLPQGKIIREVILGENGIAKALKPGTIIFDTSSSRSFDTRALGAELSSCNLILMEAPITQTYMHTTDEGGPTFMAMAGYVFHMGTLGCGYAMRTLNNYIMASSLCALSDAIVTGQKFSLDPQTMVNMLNVWTGVNFPTIDMFQRDVLPSTFNSGFGLALLIKDLGICKEFIELLQFETKLPNLLQQNLKYAL